MIVLLQADCSFGVAPLDVAWTLCQTNSVYRAQRASVCGYEKNCASALRGSGARVLVAECDPFYARQAWFEGVQMWPLKPSWLRLTSLFPQGEAAIKSSPDVAASPVLAVAAAAIYYCKDVATTLVPAVAATTVYVTA